jgi:hypothetical protein
MHPAIKGSQTVTGYKRLLAERFCDLNRPEIEKEPSRCRVGGHSCWERLVDTSPETPSVSYSPIELPAALDFLNLTWRVAFPGHRLLAMKSVESIAGLVLPCSTREEFSARLSEIADVFNLMNIDDALLPSGTTLVKSRTFDRLVAALNHSLPNHDATEVVSAVKVLRAINRVRVGHQHAGAAPEVAGALDQLGIAFPIQNYAKAWDEIRVKATGAVHRLRKAIETGLSP